MDAIAWVLIAFCLGTFLLHAFTITLVWLRCGRPPAAMTSLDYDRCTVTVIRPVCGLEDLERIALASSFTLTWPQTELIFCAASRTDPAVAFLMQQIAEHPGGNARILIGGNSETANPKLNNVIKGWQSATGTWVMLADSNLLLPPDYVEQHLAVFTPGTGLVCAPPIASHLSNFWAEVEGGFLNTYQARWQYAADTVGLGFAQGKSMLWRRADLDRLGGIAALGAELAEDAAATKLVRGLGRRVRLAGPSFEQPIGPRSAARVLSRQVRWAQLRRLTFPWYFAPEILTGSLPPALAAAFASEILDAPPGWIVGGLLTAIWFGAEVLLALKAGWPLSWRSPLAWLVRDVLIPIVWLRAYTARGYEWRGNRISVAGSGDAAMTTSAA